MDHNDSEPQVSILIPSFNHSIFVEKSILSIVNQNYNNVDITVIDDGSDDGSHKILKKLYQKYDFKMIIRENLGITKTLNEFFKMAKGKYLGICPSDDYYFINKIKSQVEILEKKPEVVVVHSKAVLVDKDDKKIKVLNEGAVFKQNWNFIDLVKNNTIIPPTSLFRKDPIKEMGYLNEQITTEDFQLWYKMLKKGKFYFQDKITMAKRKHGENTSSKSDILNKSRWESFERLFNDQEKKLAKKYLALNSFVGLSRIHKKKSLQYFYPSVLLFYKYKFILALFRLLFK